MDGSVLSLTVYNSELIAGGSFTTAGGVSANRIASWNGSAWQPLGTGTGGDVCALTIYDSDLVIGGSFVSAGGSYVNYLARWNGSSWSSIGGGMGSDVYALAVHNGDLIVGGKFMATAAGFHVYAIARWNGSTWQQMDLGMYASAMNDPIVYTLAVYNGELVAGGSFERAGNVNLWNTRYIARWDGSTWKPLGGEIQNARYASEVRTLALHNGGLTVGGTFSAWGGVGTAGVARWNGSEWESLGGGISGQVLALTVYNGDLIAGGSFITGGAVGIDSVARWNGVAWQSLGSGMGYTPRVRSLAVYENELIVGNRMYRSGDDVVAEILAWNGEAWRPLGGGMTGSAAGPYPEIYTLTAYQGELIAGGYFTTAGGVTANGVASWNGTRWQPLGNGIYGTVWALTVYNGELIAGGSFPSVDGVTVSHIARWNGSVWRPLGSGMSNEDYYPVSVRAMAVYNGELFAGGRFLTAGGVTCNNIARWNGSAWQPLGSGTEGIVLSLTVYNGELVAGGGFTTAGGVSVNRIARWNGTDWQPMGSGLNDTVYALTGHNDELIAGGSFTTAGDQVSAYWARWKAPLPVIDQQPISQMSPLGQAAVFDVVASATTGTLSYQWRKDGVALSDGGNISGAATATLTIDPVGLGDAGSYDVVVTDDCASITSNAALLTIVFPPGDFDLDGDVDQFDFGRFQACLSGDTVPQGLPECRPARMDGDSDVDKTDAALFLQCLSGPGVLADVDCAP